MGEVPKTKQNKNQLKCFTIIFEIIDVFQAPAVKGILGGFGNVTEGNTGTPHRGGERDVQQYGELFQFLINSSDNTSDEDWGEVRLP